MMRMKWMAALFAGFALAACGGGEAPEGDADAVVAEPMGGMEGMQGMEGMPMGGMQSAGMMERMRGHMQAMHGARGDSLTAMMPMHRQMTANLIAQMNREMRDMDMAADRAWTATVDSLRDDLVRLPEMSAGELEAFVPEHRRRVERLMEMHRGMMGEMGM